MSLTIAAGASLESAPETRSSTWPALLERVLLIIILAVATGRRFYGLDGFGLSETEQRSLGYCDAGGMLAFLAQLAPDWSMPVHPLLLCGVDVLFGGSDFVVRAPSAIAGVLSVYVLYRLGRDLFSPLAGFLAASWMAVVSEPVRYSQDASYVSLFVCAGLASVWSLSRILFLPRDAQAVRRRVELGGTRSSFRLSWEWQPPFPVAAADLIAFWLSSIVFFYTGLFGGVLLLVAFAGSLLAPNTLAAVDRRRLLDLVWAPVLVAAVPFFPYIVYRWNWRGYDPWEIISNSGEWQFVMLGGLVPAPILWALLLILPLAFIQLFRPGMARPVREAMVFASFYVACGIAILFLQSFDLMPLMLSGARYGGLLPCTALLVALVMFAVEVAARPLRLAGLRAAVVVLVGATWIWTGIGGERTGLPSWMVKDSADFRRAVNLLAYDPEFMSGARVVFTSNTVFNRYLDALDIRGYSSGRVLDGDDAAAVVSVLDDSVFYYLEFHGDGEDAGTASPRYEALAGRFAVACVTDMGLLRVAKFRQSAPDAGSPNAVPSCP